MSGAASGLWHGGPAVDRLALGGAPFGGLYEAMSGEQVAAVVDAAWTEGIRYFDTAPRYGNGVSETLIGRAVQSKPRAELVLSTKVGWQLTDGRPIADFTADGIRRSLEQSLQRLGLDRIDIVYLHDPDEYRAQALDEAYPALRELRDQGVVRAIGLGVNWPALPTWFVQRADLDVVLLAGRYTLLDRSAGEELLPLCLEREVAVVAAAVFNSGILADPSPGARFDYRPATQDVLTRAQHLQTICRRFGAELPAAALQFPLQHPAVATVLIGATTPAEVTADRHWMDTPLPSALWADLASA
ncbi:D-threo-aldose 1-dehydrogenase [Kribbella aluminosa]|uniref:D-threo-aldose 1-dehydrogenase n=1 Tax=Kribbella aluminosa TaxID=416017 RepID=A0ABS4UJU0_9ACTN|nr:aldo/keto reductase [Kribbella aluminosa]MBP2351908.1 D-threo-aldose 1-dehydrogenase [Kribbella aluminosa]